MGDFALGGREVEYVHRLPPPCPALHVILPFRSSMDGVGLPSSRLEIIAVAALSFVSSMDRRLAMSLYCMS
jgi:hypothetical protein